MPRRLDSRDAGFAAAFDALVDPAIGYLSDATNTRWGQRKPWLVAGTLIMCAATHMLYVPDTDTSPLAYLLTLLLFYLGVSLIETPHKAWGTELSSNYRTRSLISTALAVAFGVGTLTFALMPFLTTSSGVYSAEVLAQVAWVLVIVLPLCTASALWGVPAAAGGRSPPMTPWSVFVSVGRNRPDGSWPRRLLRTRLSPADCSHVVRAELRRVLAG